MHTSKTIYLMLLLLGCSCASMAQEHHLSLVEYDSFFQSQRPQMQAWLADRLPKGGTSKALQIAAVQTMHDQVVLRIGAKQATELGCNAARQAWLNAEASVPDFGKKTLLHWAFLAEVPNHEAVLEVTCCSQRHFHRQYAVPKVRPEGMAVKTVLPMVNIAPLAFGADETAPKSTDGSELSTVVPSNKPAEVCKKVRTFCTSKYASLPKARYLWDAELKYTDISDTEFQLEVTYITNVITADRYYEYHKIYVTTQPTASGTLLSVRLMAKYGSGIVFAPRRNDYKDMETTYKNDLSDYRNIFFRQITNAAGK